MSAEAARVVSALATARKAVQLYPPTHPKYIEALRDLQESVRRASAAGPLVVNLYQGRLYWGSEVIDSEVPGAASIAETLEARRVESLTFESGFNEGDAVGLVETLALRPTPELDVGGELEARGVANVAIAFLVDADADDVKKRDERDRQREQGRALYKQLVAALKVIRERLATGQAVALDQAGDLAHTIAARLLKDKASTLGLATLSVQGEESLFHGVNVMIYSLALGAALEVPEEGLNSLGIAALLHDVGKARFDMDDPAQADRVQPLHPVAGAELLSQLIETDSAPMLVAYEHHMAVDGSGYPEHPEDYFAHLYSRIVAIADRYENLTKGDGAGPTITPDRAVAQLLSEAGSALDALLVRLFVGAIGVFPIGCMVRLSDQSIGVVYDAGDDPLSPKVRLLYGPDGEQFESPPEIDLAADDRAIVEVVDPEILRVQVADHL